MEKTKVIFRLVSYRSGYKEVLAMFPEQAETDGSIACYAHLGQHGTCGYHYVIRISRPATEEEYKDLYKELVGIGYILEIRKKHQFLRR